MPNGTAMAVPLVFHLDTPIILFFDEDECSRELGGERFELAVFLGCKLIQFIAGVAAQRFAKVRLIERLGDLDPLAAIPEQHCKIARITGRELDLNSAALWQRFNKLALVEDRNVQPCNKGEAGGKFTGKRTGIQLCHDSLLVTQVEEGHLNAVQRGLCIAVQVDGLTAGDRDEPGVRGGHGRMDDMNDEGDRCRHIAVRIGCGAGNGRMAYFETSARYRRACGGSCTVHRIGCRGG